MKENVKPVICWSLCWPAFQTFQTLQKVLFKVSQQPAAGNNACPDQ